MASTSQLINKFFLETALTQYFKNNVNISKYTLSNVVPVGDNFCSTLIRVRITYTINEGFVSENRTLSVICKCFPEDENVAKMIRYKKCFEGELGVYSEVLPVLKSLDYNEKLAPEAIYITYKPTPVVILEDLKTLNYKMQQCDVGLDLNHCFMVVEKMAYMHASTAAVHEKNPSLLVKYDQGVFAQNDLFTNCFHLCFESLIEVCETVQALQRYVSRIKSVKEALLQKIYASNRRSSKFNVLNHGDAWSNNFMFTYGDNGKPTTVAFIDFQLPLFSSPVLDLQYLWAVSTSIDVKTNHLEDVKNHYFNELMRNLKKLCVNVTPPTREEFDLEFHDRAAFGFAAAAVTMPFIRATGRPDASLFNFFGSGSKGSYRYDCFNSKGYVNELVYLLPFYDSMGVFD